jgi:serine protease Do
MRGYIKQLSWTVVLATATALAQTTPPAAPSAPATPPAEAPDETPAPQEKIKTPKPPRPAKPPKIARNYAYTYSTGEEGGSYLGVGVRDVTSDSVAQLKLKDEHGVEVTSIDSEGPAAKAGVKEHDVILTFNGQTIEGYEQLRRMIRETPAGRSVKLGVSRAGQPLTLTVPLGKREEWSFVRPNIVTIPKVTIPQMNFEWDAPGFAVLQIASRSGATVEDLTPQLGDYFGAKGGEGVLVRNVERGSPAESAGLKAGDVIVKIAQDRVSNSSDWRRLMRGQKAGPIAVTILRDRHEQTISIKLPERRSSDAATFQFDFPADMPGFDAAELDKFMKELQPEIERAQKSAMISMKTMNEKTQREIERKIERSMRQLERELERQQKTKDEDKE